MIIESDRVGKIVNGFEKVASVIDGNENYAYILGERLNNPRYKGLINDKNEVDLLDAENFLINEVQLKKKISYYALGKKINEKNILSYGKTDNNKKELSFFFDSLKEICSDISEVNIADRKLTYSTVDGDLKDFSSELLDAICVFFKKRRKSFNLSLVHQFCNYISSLFCAYKSLANCNAKVILLANDHSPLPVSFFVASNLKNIKTVYIQHAEVTEIFPQNNFDYSVFRNAKSLNVYNSISSIKGKFSVISRSNNEFELSDIVKCQEKIRKSKSVDVYIYPSSVLNINVLKTVYNLLRKNSSVKNIYLKPHPSVKKIDILTSIGFLLLNHHVDFPHLAICGNSSVAIELLSKGSLVFQLFSLDDIRSDYYGFCKDGLIEELKNKNLLEKFWYKTTAENSNLENIYKLYFPNVNSENLNLNKINFQLMLSEILLVSNAISNFSYKKICDALIFKKNLFVFTSSFLTHMRNYNFRGKDEFWMIRELNALFDNRDTSLPRIYSFAQFDNISSILDFWILSKQIEWNGYTPTVEELKKLIDFSINNNMDKKAENWCAIKVFDILIRHSEPELLTSFIDINKEINLEKIGINKKVAFLNYIKFSKLDSLSFYEDCCKKNLSKLDKLKIDVQCFNKVDGELVYNNYIDVENEFLASLPTLYEEYTKKVKSVYQKLGSRACYIDVRRNSNQYNNLLTLIENNLKNKSGFSLIRTSDGEGFLFEKFSNYFSENDSLNRQRHWWGLEIDKKLKEELIYESIKAIKNSDVIGMPSIYRFLRDHSDKSKSLTQNIQGRGLITVLKGIESIDSGEQLYTDDKVNLALFNDISNIKKLSYSAKRTIIVNSASEHSIKIAFEEIDSFIHIQIPTHNKTSTNLKYSNSGKPLPYVYKDIYKKIINTAEPGDLVLVGAGVAGKVFIDAAKQKNAVGLDIGSAMDELIGGGIHSLF